jgi:hypothetical protein
MGGRSFSDGVARIAFPPLQLMGGSGYLSGEKLLSELRTVVDRGSMTTVKVVVDAGCA